jgi:hypothetical protein
MAESDTRLETLEDEVKVLKGEFKRTLVDLRALLMREDLPWEMELWAGAWHCPTGEEKRPDRLRQRQPVPGWRPPQV